MSELGDVLEAMNAAPRDFDILLGEISSWQDIDVIRRAMERPSGGGMVSAALFARADGPAADRPITRLWFARDGRFRSEQHWATNVFDGTDLWLRTGDRLMQQGPNDDPLSAVPCSFMLRPGPLLAFCRLAFAGHDRVAGHDTVVLEGELANNRQFVHPSLLLAMAADRVRLHIDPRSGVLLRAETWFKGQPAMRTEFEALDYDVPLVHDPFKVDREPGERIWTRRDQHRETLERAGVDPADVDLDDDRSVMEAFRSALGDRPPSGFAPPSPLHPPMSLAERYMAVGRLPDDVEAAHAAVVEAIEHISDVDDAGGLPNVQGGSNLGAAVREATSRVRIEAQATYEVDEVVFVRADEAVVAFRVMVPVFAGGYPQTGRVLKIGDRWLVERATMCGLISAAGVRCPPPPDEP